jgi:hypothetical protein
VSEEYRASESNMAPPSHQKYGSDNVPGDSPVSLPL